MDAPTTDPAAPDVWHRVNPLTPLLESVGVLVAIVLGLAYALQNFIQRSLESLAVGDGVDMSGADWIVARPMLILAGVGGIVLIVALAALWSWLAWRVMGYRVDSEAIYSRSGLISKKMRKARLDRVQSIDLQQKLLPRLLGLAELVFDVAGGKGSNVSLKYLARKRAEELRDELLAAVREKKDEELAPAEPDTHLGEAPSLPESIEALVPERAGDSIGVRLTKRLGRVAGNAAGELEDSLNGMLAAYDVSARVREEGEIIRVPVHRVLVASLLKSETIIGALVVIAVIVSSIVFFAIGITEAGFGILFGAIPGLLSIGAMFNRDLNNANFVVRVTDSGLAVSHGLFSTSRKVIPLDRVQAVCLHQPLLWRKAGWWKAEFNIASAGDSNESNLLLPVGDIDQALLMVGLALPDPQVTGLGEGENGARSLVLSAMYADRSPDPDAASAEALFHGQPRSSRLIDPLVWKRRAYALTQSLLVVRLGRLDRRVDFVPHVRVQSMRYRQGPLMRRLGLGSVAVHSTAGPISPHITHQSEADARRFFVEHAERTREARQRFDAEAAGGIR